MIRVVKELERFNSHFYGRKPSTINKELWTYVKINQKYWMFSENILSSKSGDRQVIIERPWLLPKTGQKLDCYNLKTWFKLPESQTHQKLHTTTRPLEGFYTLQWLLCQSGPVLSLKCANIPYMYGFEIIGPWKESRYCLYKLICKWELLSNSKYNKTAVFSKNLTLPRPSFEAIFPIPSCWKNFSFL